MVSSGINYKGNGVILKYTEQSNGCWHWNGALGSNGYGVYYKGKYKNGYAHRLVYEQMFGKIPNKLFVCHSCDNKVCIRPSHLFLGTNLDNIRDMQNKGRNRGPKRKDYCLRGHNKNGKRNCSECLNYLARKNYDPVKRHNKYLNTRSKHE
jgi:hypothetical protein